MGGEKLETEWNQKCLASIRLEKEMGSERYYREIRLPSIGETRERTLNATGPPRRYPWKRDISGKPIEREPKAVCSVCGQLIFDNVDPEKDIICGLCVQKELVAFNQRKSPVEESVKNRVSEIVSKAGIRKVASFMGMSRSSIQRRLRTGNFSEKEASDILQGFPAPGSPG